MCVWGGNCAISCVGRLPSGQVPSKGTRYFEATPPESCCDEVPLKKSRQDGGRHRENLGKCRKIQVFLVFIFFRCFSLDLYKDLYKGRIPPNILQISLKS